MKIEWPPRARALARRYMADQDAMRAIGGAIAQLAANPYRRKPSTGATTTGCASAAYRVVYMIEGDLVTIERVDRVA